MKKQSTGDGEQLSLFSLQDFSINTDSNLTESSLNEAEHLSINKLTNLKYWCC